MKVVISLDVLNQVIKFLEQMPYGNVCNLMKQLMEDVTGQKPIDSESEKEEEKHDAAQ
jgi:hypothetical protein